jgi:hypothetical protein
MSVATMAKKKAPLGDQADDRQIVISVKGSAEFRDWLNDLADHQRISAVKVIELALVEYARNHGFTKAAPKRTK